MSAVTEAAEVLAGYGWEVVKDEDRPGYILPWSGVESVALRDPFDNYLEVSQATPTAPFSIYYAGKGGFAVPGLTLDQIEQIAEANQ
jgi:hypothetical protein